MTKRLRRVQMSNVILALENERRKRQNLELEERLEKTLISDIDIESINSDDVDFSK